ncbi:mCG145210, partial [Mus musculus]
SRRQPRVTWCPEADAGKAAAHYRVGSCLLRSMPYSNAAVRNSLKSVLAVCSFKLSII